MAKRNNKPRALKRRAARRPPNLTVYVVAEGAKTEPQYIKDFAKDVGNNLVDITIVNDGGDDPKKVVDEAVEVHREKKREARRATNSFEWSFLVVALFDCDDHGRLNDALQKAHDNRVTVGVSNPCFELWILLHFKYVSGYLHREDAHRELRSWLSSYDHKRNPVIDYMEIADRYHDAYRRSECLLRDREAEDNSVGNPSTTVHHLLEKIREGGLKVPK